MVADSDSKKKPLLAFVLCTLLLPSASADGLHTCSPTLNTPGATFPKGDIFLEKGNPLEILCVLNESYADHNSSNLAFFRDSGEVLPQYVNIVNKTTLRFYMADPPESSSMYYCKLKPSSGNQELQAVCLNKVFVGTKPQEVQNFSCVSHNWNNLTCTWKTPENYIPTKYHLFYRFPGRAGGRTLYRCPQNSRRSNSCYWDEKTNPHYRQPFEYFYFTMVGENELGNITSQHKFHHFAHVIPAPPSDLSLLSETSYSALLTWKVPFPMQNFPPGLVSKVEYQSHFDHKDSWTVVNTSSLRETSHNITPVFNLTGLKYPNALYDVRVYIRSAAASVDGKWSTSANLTFRTKPTVPGMSPKTDIGSFELAGGLPYRDVYVYWQQIPDTLKNGDNFMYKIIQVEENGVKRNLEPAEITKAYAKFKSISFNSYRFKIVASNSVGNSETFSEVFVPSKQNSPPEPTSFTKMAFGDGVYELSWKPPEQGRNILTYTIFWCEHDRDRPYQCTGYLDWTHVSKDVMNKNITVSPKKVYQFAISANTNTVSSGMVWASCTVIHNKVVDKMKNVWINRVGSTFIEVGWKLDCSDRMGVVIGFRIYYCPVVSLYEVTCKEPEINKTVLGDPLTTWSGIAVDLKPYTTYMVAVAVITKHGEGSRSNPLYNATLEGAPDPVEDVTISDVTNTSMIVKWKPPVNTNGHLRFYEVHFNGEKKIVENEMMVKLTNLTSHKNYSVGVAACTVLCSDVLNPETVKTAVGVPGIMEEPDVRFINSSQVLVRWKPPTNPGGQPEFYEVMVQQSDGKSNISHYKYEIRDDESQLSIPNCENKASQQKYVFYVRAVNRDKSGNLLKGPWSPPGEGDCYSSGPSRELLIVIWIFGIMALAVMIMLCGYIGRRLWLRYKKMHDIKVTLPPGLAPCEEKEKDQEFGAHHWQAMDSHEHLHIKPRSNTSADQELLLQKKEERHGRNPSGDSSGCSSGHESVSSSLTSGTQISSDSGTEVDQRPPSPDGVFEESPAWESSSLRQRSVKGSLRSDGDTSRWDPYVKMGKGCSDSGSVARSTPNLSEMEGLGAPGYSCLGTWSVGYISMPSSEEIGSGGEVGGEGGGYCRVGMEVSSSAAPPHATSPQPGKGYVSLASMIDAPSTPSMSPSSGNIPPQSRGYVTHPLWAVPTEVSPSKGYVMAGQMIDGSPGPELVPQSARESMSAVENEMEGEGEAATSDSYCRFGLRPTTGPGGEGGQRTLPKPGTGYVTLTDATSTPVSASVSNYVPHRHFDKLPHESYTKVFPPNTGEPKVKSPTTSV